MPPPHGFSSVCSNNMPRRASTTYGRHISTSIPSARLVEELCPFMRCVDWFCPTSGSSGNRLQLSYPVHLLLGIPDQIRTRGGSLSHLRPTNRRSTWPPIQSLIERHLYTRLITVVVGELCQGQVLIPATLEVQDACS